MKRGGGERTVLHLEKKPFWFYPGDKGCLCLIPQRSCQGLGLCQLPFPPPRMLLVKGVGGGGTWHLKLYVPPFHPLPLLLPGSPPAPPPVE